MNSRFFDSRHLDVAAFAEHGGEMAGEIPLADLQRLRDFAAPDVPPESHGVVVWRARGELRSARGGQPPQVWLHLQADATLAMTCQRCLQPLPERIQVDRQLRFVAGEEAAAAEDAESEDDVLAMNSSLVLASLIEDELVLALPWVPRHEVCPHPLPLSVAEDEPAQEPVNPFAVLAQLKKSQDS